LVTIWPACFLLALALYLLPFSFLNFLLAQAVTENVNGSTFIASSAKKPRDRHNETILEGEKK
jgi:hypothetical protein